MRNHYPFAALVGQEALQTALLLCAVNPSIGGVLIAGDKGSAKSTAARGLAQIMPFVERADGCRFNCSSAEPLEICPVCCGADAVFAEVAPPFVTLPLGATEDRVLGSLDFECALKDKRRAFQPGLLAAAHRGVLYIDEVNLLPDHLVDVLLDAAAMGVHSLQREGLSVVHPCRFTLIGTMNLEEGDLRPQLLDRFGLMVEVAAPRKPVLRAEVVRRRFDFEGNPQAFLARFEQEQEKLRAQVVRARCLLPSVKMDERLLLLISQLCCRLEINSLRADIVMHKTALALAALGGRTRAEPSDIKAAAELALPHRRRRTPLERAGIDCHQLEQMLQEALSEPPPEPDDQGDESGADQSLSDWKDSIACPEDSDGSSASGKEEVFLASAPGSVCRIVVATEPKDSNGGRRSPSGVVSRGQYLRAVPAENPSSLAVDATLSHAVLRCPEDFGITREDFHEKSRRCTTGNLILFVVDASGSMSALRRMETVKSCVVSLLADAYERRDKVGVISFSGSGAELILAPTKSVELAEAKLRDLPTGGRTPLTQALVLAYETLDRQMAKNSLEPLLVVMSDGKANVAISGQEDPFQEALRAACRLSELSVATLVVDSETGYLRLGKARELASALRAEYLSLENMSSEDLTLIIGRRGKGRLR